MPRRFLPLALLCIAGILGAEPACDRYGDRLPEGAIARLGDLRFRPEWPVITGGFSPDGKFLATGERFNAKGVVTLWDTATGKEARRLPANLRFSLQGLRYSADGKSLFLIGSDGNFCVIDAATGAEQRKLATSTHNTLLVLDVARDEKTAVTTDFRGNIVVWDLVRGERLLERTIPVNRFIWHDRAPFRPLTALTPDGKQLVCPQADCSLHLVNVATGEKVVAFEMPDSRAKGAYNLELPTVTVSPDGRYLAYASTWIPPVLCDLKTGKILHPLTARHTNSMRFFFTPDSRSVIAHSGSAIHLFATASGKEIRKIERSSWMGYPLALSPDGKTLAHVKGHGLSLWDLSAGRQLHSSICHTDFVQSIVFFPDGKRLVSSDAAGNRIVWDIASAQVLVRHDTINLYDKPRSLALNTDGKTVQFLSFDYKIHRWNPSEGGKSSEQKFPPGNPSDFILSPDGRTLAATYIPKISQAKLHDLQDGKAERTITMPKNLRVESLLFSPDSRRLLIRASDNIHRLWDRDTGKLVREIPPAESRSGSIYPIFSPDGRSLVYHDYGAGLGALGMGVRIREIASGGFRLHIPTRGGNPLAYSPDGRFLACASPPWSIQVLGMATGKELARWQGPQVPIFAFTFSPDSRLLASGYGDGTILLWKVPDGEGLPTTLKGDEAKALWQALADDAATANRAVAGLAAAPAQAVPLLKERFPTDWKKPDDKQITRWIAKLDDDDFKVREQATRELSDAGFDVADALHQALANAPSAEAKRRMEGLLNRLNKGGDPKRLRALRAIEVLERIGSPQAKEVLRALAGKSLPTDLREEVQASLRRLGEKP
jgi:WD40 repeat protein